MFKSWISEARQIVRFVRKLKVSQPERVWRMECRPGEEMQVDFGLGAPIEDGGTTRRRNQRCAGDKAPDSRGLHRPFSIDVSRNRKRVIDQLKKPTMRRFLGFLPPLIRGD